MYKKNELNVKIDRSSPLISEFKQNTLYLTFKHVFFSSMLAAWMSQDPTVAWRLSLL